MSSAWLAAWIPHLRQCVLLGAAAFGHAWFGVLAGRAAGATALYETVTIFIMTELYSVNAEFYDAVSVEAWKLLRPALVAALADARPHDGPLVDVGAGTGLATAVIAEAIPDGEILAIEPSAALRPALLTRVMVIPGLRERVTIIPTSLAGADLPDRLGGVVAANMLGHLAPEARRDFWHLLADRLAYGAPAVLGLQSPERPEVVPDRSYVTRVQVGRHTYEGWGGARPSGPETIQWRMTWRILAGDRVIAERVAETEWWTVSQATVLRELREAGLDATPGDAGFLTATRA